MNYWLMKTEPGTYSWDDLVRDKSTEWDGVRNYLARNNMREMKKGDLVLIYHSVGEKRVVGIATVSAESHPDSTDTTETWDCVDVRAVKSLTEPVTLAVVKATPALADMKLVTHSRLSVQPVSPKHFQKILSLAKTEL